MLEFLVFFCLKIHIRSNLSGEIAILKFMQYILKFPSTNNERALALYISPNEKNLAFHFFGVPRWRHPFAEEWRVCKRG
jgi:hypothetical protein